jgi:hypothetical protein
LEKPVCATGFFYADSILERRETLNWRDDLRVVLSADKSSWDMTGQRPFFLFRKELKTAFPFGVKRDYT